MVVTPWGESEALRARRLRPGGAESREKAAANQRARIYGAIVASTAERGYQGTRLEDLVEISGVSMRSFYELFPDKEAAFVAALELLLEKTIAAVLFDRGSGGWDEGMSQRLRGFGELLEHQAPAAKMCLIEAYAAGPKAAELVERAIMGAEELVGERLAESPERAAMPTEMAVAAVGAVLEVARSYLMRGGGSVQNLLPGLLAFLFGFRPPSAPLRSAARTPETRPESSEASDHAERALRAFEALLVDERFPEVTMEQVAQGARMSRRTLYANFTDREQLLDAAIESACAQVVAVTLPAFHRHNVPAEGLRAAIAALLAFLASRPRLANLLLVAVGEGGERALRRRQRSLRPLRLLLQGVPATPPGAALSGIALEATLGGLLALMRRRWLQSGASGLVGLGPICTYIALAPVIGQEQATIAAEGRTYRRGRPDLRTSVIRTELAIASNELPMGISYGQSLSATEIAEELGVPIAEAEARIEELIEAGLVKVAEEDAGEGQRLYRSAWPLIALREWSQIERAERESQSAEIAQMIALEVEEAFAAGSFDSRPERHLVRIAGRLDEEGWKELNEKLTVTSYECLDIERRARERLAAAGEDAESISMRAYVVSFEAAPQADTRIDPEAPSP